MQRNEVSSARFQHVDALRGLAVLAMVQVHTTGLLPAPIKVTHFLALMSAAIGGMAAPLFVTLSGWAVYRGLRRRIDAKHPIIRWLWVRVFALLFFQLVINLLLPQRFRWYTPGVLSLLAICTLFCPLMMIREWPESPIPAWATKFRARIFLVIGIALTPLLTFSAIPSLVPEEEWWWFVEASTIGEWFLRLFINGTYPVFPWLAFFTIGGWLEHTQLATSEKKQVLARSGLLAFATLVLTGTLSFITGRSWALTIGNGTLTFFPANPWFVLVSLTWVIFLWDIFRAYSYRLDPLMRLLAPSGRLSLTIYVFHFAILGGLVPYLPDELGIMTVFLITSAHVLLWVGASIVHQSMSPNLSLEALLRSLSARNISQNGSNLE